MHKGRLEAFSDGVIAIIITIMVLELHVPKSDNIAAIFHLWPTFLTYVLSFIYVGIYWNNHHHTMQAVKSVNGSILWANLLLLFWLSVIPFVTQWMGESMFTKWPVVLYGCILIMNAASYTVLMIALIRHHGQDSVLAKAVGDDRKGKLSLVIYAVAIAVSFFCSWVGFALYIVVACIWFIPDRRIERKIVHEEPTE